MLDNYNPNQNGGGFAPAPQHNSAMEAAVVSRQAQEVQAAMVVAKRFPRDENAAYTRIIQACQRKSLAESAEYEFPRGGSKVNGPSIRLAEVLAQSWGNIDYGVTEAEQKDGESTMLAYAWDLETNTRRSMTFVVKHERKAKGRINKLDDPRDIYEMTANQGSRRVRACILGVIPGDIVEAAVNQCRATLTTGNKTPLKDRVRAMIAEFDSTYQVKQEWLEKYIGCNADAFSENDVRRLGNVFRSLRDGMAKREQYFGEWMGLDNKTPETVSSKTQEAFEKSKKTNGPKEKTDVKAGSKAEGGALNDLGIDESKLPF
ncbi:hypothetical protein [Paenibacillus polymyxa]|uniref:hypothetical protein n=1 Tax=Paenibacillus polymyxa TaxID=1406 RepID=UPI0007E9D651|nr:hypothetical protein [Paenibacillus polymyxa]OAZ43366.1 hypothetical protein A9Z39_22265 [Paenibacillus polymyxa]